MNSFVMQLKTRMAGWQGRPRHGVSDWPVPRHGPALSVGVLKRIYFLVSMIPWYMLMTQMKALFAWCSIN